MRGKPNMSETSEISANVLPVSRGNAEHKAHCLVQRVLLSSAKDVVKC